VWDASTQQRCQTYENRCGDHLAENDAYAVWQSRYDEANTIIRCAKRPESGRTAIEGVIEINEERAPLFSFSAIASNRASMGRDISDATYLKTDIRKR
jgi:hypothetical protein